MNGYHVYLLGKGGDYIQRGCGSAAYSASGLGRRPFPLHRLAEHLSGTAWLTDGCDYDSMISQSLMGANYLKPVWGFEIRGRLSLRGGYVMNQRIIPQNPFRV